MRDLNFFYAYKGNKKYRLNKQMAYYFILIFCVFLMVLYSLFNCLRIRSVSKDIIKLKAIVDNEKVKSRIRELEEMEMELNQLKLSLEEIKKLDDFINENRIIDDSLLEIITGSISAEIFLTSISIHNDKVEIIGKAKDKSSIVNLVRSLEGLETFKDLFISSISKDGHFYSFIINIRLKDLEVNGVEEKVENIQVTEETE